MNVKGEMECLIFLNGVDVEEMVLLRSVELLYEVLFFVCMCTCMCVTTRNSSASVSGEIHSSELPFHNLLEWFCKAEVIKMDL